MSSHTGTVKFYRRQQAYGFIKVDGGSDEDESSGVPAEVFVHRNSIHARDDAEGNVYYPFLREGERVAFDVERVEGQQRPVAKELTFEDGSIIPTVRPGVSLYWTTIEYVRWRHSYISHILKNGATSLALFPFFAVVCGWISKGRREPVREAASKDSGRW